MRSVPGVKVRRTVNLSVGVGQDELLNSLHVYWVSPLAGTQWGL